jgi:hypothetical protein
LKQPRAGAPPIFSLKSEKKSIFSGDRVPGGGFAHGFAAVFFCKKKEKYYRQNRTTKNTLFKKSKMISGRQAGFFEIQE